MWTSRRGSVGLLLSAAVLAAAAAATAQTTTGAIEGRAVGPDGGVLPGVTVTATGALPASRVASSSCVRIGCSSSSSRHCCAPGDRAC